MEYESIFIISSQKPEFLALDEVTAGDWGEES